MGFLFFGLWWKAYVFLSLRECIHFQRKQVLSKLLCLTPEKGSTQKEYNFAPIGSTFLPLEVIKFFPFRADLFSEGAWCAAKQIGSHESCKYDGNVLKISSSLKLPWLFWTRIPLMPALGVGLMQPCKLQCSIWRDSIKPSLRFSWFCVFFVSKRQSTLTFILLYCS